MQLHVSVAATVVSTTYRQPRPAIRAVHGVYRRHTPPGILSITALGCVSPHAHRDPVVSVLSPTVLPHRLNPPPLHPDAPPPPAPFAHLLLHVHGPCCTDVPSPCLEMSSLHRPTHHRRLMCPMSALMRSAAAGSIRADWSLQHGTGMEQACGEGANRGVHRGRVAVSTCHATELPVLEWPSAGQYQHTQTTKKKR